MSLQGSHREYFVVLQSSTVKRENIYAHLTGHLSRQKSRRYKS